MPELTINLRQLHEKALVSKYNKINNGDTVQHSESNIEAKRKPHVCECYTDVDPPQLPFTLNFGGRSFSSTFFSVLVINGMTRLCPVLIRQMLVTSTSMCLVLIYRISRKPVLKSRLWAAMLEQKNK